MKNKVWDSEKMTRYQHWFSEYSVFCESQWNSEEWCENERAEEDEERQRAHISDRLVKIDEKRLMCRNARDGLRETDRNGRMDDGGPCSTCDGWGLAQVWRRDQIKSLSRQQWTRDKVITLAGCAVYHRQCGSVFTWLSSALSSALALLGQAPQMNDVRHISIMFPRGLWTMTSLTLTDGLNLYRCPWKAILIKYNSSVSLLARK